MKNRYVPTWMQDTVTKVLVDFHIKPCVLLYNHAEVGHKSGRCFYRLRIIAVKCTDEDCEFSRAIVLHELAHLLDSRGEGRHDDIFYFIVELLYSRYGISNKTASAIEEIIPRSYWRTSKNWNSKLIPKKRS